MSLLTQNEIHKFAEAVSNDFVTHQIPLNESVEKLATARNLNEDQIGRVCEAANNLTFNKLFKNTDKTASDRIVEFDVADRRKIMNNMIKQAGAALPVPQKTTKVAAYELRPLEDERYYARRGEEEPGEVKTASFEMRPPSKDPVEKSARTVRKTIDHLCHEKHAYDVAYMDKIEEMRVAFRRVYNDLPFGTFEKQAVALWEKEAEPVMSSLREALRMPEVEYNYSKLKKHAGWVDDTHPHMSLLKEALEINKMRNRITRAINKLEASL